jgi:hypothetical protein
MNGVRRLSAYQDTLEREILAFELRYTCDDCAHFDPEKSRCAHGYPTEPHRRTAEAEVVFCKEFELGT